MKLKIVAYAHLECEHVIDLTERERAVLVFTVSEQQFMTCPKCDPRVAACREVVRMEEVPK